jgi:uncharacterized protein
VCAQGNGTLGAAAPEPDDDQRARALPTQENLMAPTTTGGAAPTDTTRSPATTWQTLDGRATVIEGGLWARRQAINRDGALPHGYRMLEVAGNLENLRIAAGTSTGRYRGPVFMDSDVYKWIEAAAYEHARVPSDWLVSHMRAAIDVVGAAQGADGYLNSHYQVAEPGRRWTDFAHGHELYCAGHLFQAAVAHRRATGEDRLLAIARRFADYLDARFGPGKQPGTPGHPEIEMGLVELYRQTGERRYLALARFFLDQRGHGWLGPGRYNSSAYYQDRVPIREATEVEGHAVRSLYLTAGVADVYLETGEAALLSALERQWSDLVSHKLYVTGGVGSRHLGEAFGQPYELPNDLAYDETCAAIASILWSWRMLLATGQSRFAELIDRTLHNAVLAGVSLDGERYFYVNPLASNGLPEHLGRGGCRRKEWHLVACCPPNVMRLVASLGHYVASCDRTGLQVHQYAPARIATALPSGPAVALRLETRYPWEGAIRLTVEAGDGGPWTLALRVPGWSGHATARVNGGAVDASPSANGYLRLERSWRAGDVVELEFPMAVTLIEPHPAIESTRGCVAIERGPLVYCVEQVDQGEAPLTELEIDATGRFASHWEPDLLEGIVTIRAAGFQVDTASWRGRLYRPAGSAPPPRRRGIDLTAIPYYAWANRAAGAMRVWIPRATI